MYTRRLRYATRWNRRLVWALAILLLLALGWRAYRAVAQPPVAQAVGRLV